MSEGMRFAYADPPYLNCGALYAKHHPNAMDWDDPEVHRRLISRLVDEYSDGWAMSASSPSLRTVLPMCPEKARMLAWVKPFCSFKPGVGLAYAWEPVIFVGGRRRKRDQDTVRDWMAASITLQRGLTGAKPAAFVQWLLDALNVEPSDVVDDLFPGTGGCGDVIAARLTPRPSMTDLFAARAQSP